MTARRVSDAAPLRFLLAIVCLWVVARGAVALSWQPTGAPAEAALLPVTAAVARIELPLDPVAVEPEAGGWEPVAATVSPARPRPRPVAQGRAISVALDEAEGGGDAPPLPEPGPDRAPVRLAALTERAPPVAQTYRRASGEAEAATALAPPVSPPGAHWTGSAWAFVRGGGRATALSPGGQIGGGQAGARLLYRLHPGGLLALAGRVSRTIGGIRQTEATAGLDWQPVARLPVHLMAERRVAIDRGGRNAWTMGVAGGAYAVPVGRHWRFDGYGEAGVVGARRRDLYADGAARLSRAVDLGAGRSLSLGGGVWAAAQPRVSRVDIGPTAVLRLPVSGRTLSLALDWRQRVAGRAKPGSGVALTTAVDF